MALTDDADEVLGGLKEELMSPSGKSLTAATAAAVLSAHRGGGIPVPVAPPVSTSTPESRSKALWDILRSQRPTRFYNLRRENSIGAGDLSCAGLDQQRALNRAVAEARPDASAEPDLEEGGESAGGGGTGIGMAVGGAAGGFDAAGGARLRGSLN